MRVERRRRVTWVCLVVNRRGREEPGERTEVVRDFEAHGL
jgi:hypothetical protein